MAVITADDELWGSTSRRLEEHALIPERLSSPLGREGRKLADRADAVLVDARDVDVPGAIEAWLHAGWIDRTCPVMVVSPDAPERETHLGWLRGGAWGVLRTPVDGELLAVQLETQLRSARADEEGRPSQPLAPYSWPAFVSATEETLALARRHGRPLGCVAITLDWADGPGHPGTRDVIGRLARPAQLAARRYDLVGIGRTGTLLMVLPDTTAGDTEAFRQRLIPFLEDHLRSWGILARLRAGVAQADADGPEERATDFLTRATRATSAAT